ncbi:hypothetical protein D1B31_10580 [Neobacillus notoginsengisoli]|uniref:SPOR domain-containing protein n=1 Tax=Neobacillus notoginsengisoli TaxID=1578198 RepID=A0A417YTX5_9BACI|nr:hypothetical protein [Neobacillus notoginsengisoli]RHW40637.1 hypothetical protein D1B31_10580 [Neobacillus notoginsengisoli]
MDKQKVKPITIKINGEEKPIQHQMDKPGDPHDSVNKEQTYAEEHAAALEAEDENFEWILPEQEPVESEEFIIKEAANTAAIYPKQTKSSNKKRFGPLKPIVFSIVFAVLVGLTYGAVMLKLVLTDKPVVTAGKPIDTEQPTGGNGEKTSPAKKAATEPVMLLPVTAFAVQEGVYSGKDAALVVKNELEAKGIPSAILDMDDKKMLLVGLAGSIESAKEIGAILKEKGIDFYAKEITLSERKAGKASTTEKGFLDKAPGIYDALSTAAAAAYSGKNVSSIADTGSILEAIDASKFSNDKIIALYNELSKAAGSLDNFEKKHESADAHSAQQHLLNFLEKYQAF